jgi:hypothetical protein
MGNLLPTIDLIIDAVNLGELDNQLEDRSFGRKAG